MRSLRAAQRRIRFGLFVEWLMVFALLIAAGLVVWAALGRWLGFPLSLDQRTLAGAPAAAVLLAVLAAAFHRISLDDVATTLDRLGDTHDRFLTALSFSKAPDAFQDLALHECRRFLARNDFSRRIPLRWPREARWLAVPLLALALLHWESRIDAAARALAAEAAQREVAPTLRQLDQLAKQISKDAEANRDEELKKIAAQLKKSADQLRAQENGADDAAKAALRELSKLEQLVQQMQQPPASASPEELKQLAKALEQNDATKQAAAAMQSGKLDAAAERLDDAAKQPDKEAAEKTLREALERLAQQQKISAALQQLAKQAQQNGPGGDTMKQLAEMLRKMAQQQGSPGQQSRPATEQEMKNLLSALQNMKYGEGDPQPGNSPPQGDGKQGKVSIQSFAKNGDGKPEPDGSQIPSGQPGGERDPGTTESALGKEAAPRPEKGADASLKGRLAEGESLSSLLPSAGDTSKSRRRYQELYEAAAPAAAAAAQQENIPLGSRFFIKRYFESIRPKE